MWQAAPDRAAPMTSEVVRSDPQGSYGSDLLRSTIVESARATALLRRRIAPSDPIMARVSTTTAVVRCLFDDGDLEMDTVSRNDTRIAPVSTPQTASMSRGALRWHVSDRSRAPSRRSCVISDGCPLRESSGRGAAPRPGCNPGPDDVANEGARDLGRQFGGFAGQWAEHRRSAGYWKRGRHLLAASRISGSQSEAKIVNAIAPKTRSLTEPPGSEDVPPVFLGV